MVVIPGNEIHRANRAGLRRPGLSFRPGRAFSCREDLRAVRWACGPALRTRVRGGFRLLPVWVVRAAVAQVGRSGDIRRGWSSSRKCGNRRNPSSTPASYICTSSATPLRQDLSIDSQNFRSDLNGRTPVPFVLEYPISFRRKSVRLNIYELKEKSSQKGITNRHLFEYVCSVVNFRQLPLRVKGLNRSRGSLGRGVVGSAR